MEISVNNGFVDIVAERFDAGVRLGETLAQDMVAVRIGPDMRMAVVGSPSYLAGRPLPRTPHDLAEHICIGLRYTAEGGIGIWDLEKAGRAVKVRVESQLIVNNIALARLGALQGVGLAYLPDDYVAPLIIPAHWSASWKSGASSSLAIICTTRADASSRAPSPSSLKPYATATERVTLIPIPLWRQRKILDLCTKPSFPTRPHGFNPSGPVIYVSLLWPLLGGGVHEIAQVLDYVRH